jgi:hypothetical protein
MQSVQEASRTSIYCATSPDVVNQTGLYYDNCGVKAPAAIATPELGVELWKRSTAWVTDSG